MLNVQALKHASTHLTKYKAVVEFLNYKTLTFSNQLKFINGQHYICTQNDSMLLEKENTTSPGGSTKTKEDLGVPLNTTFTSSVHWTEAAR